MCDNGGKWKQLADRTETEGNILCKHLDGQALFTGIKVVLYLGNFCIYIYFFKINKCRGGYVGRQQ
jgi:hypothetical protein